LIMVVCYFEKWSVMEYKVHLFSFSELFEKLVNLSLSKIVTNILYYIINMINDNSIPLTFMPSQLTR
jgi:hypothetical protein